MLSSKPDMPGDTTGDPTGDPVTTRLGKDLAALVYRYVHAIWWKQVNKEYFDCFVPDDKRFVPTHKDAVMFWNQKRKASIKRFNYRSESSIGSSSDKIFRWDFFQKQPKKYTKAKLPKNYLR